MKELAPGYFERGAVSSDDEQTPFTNPRDAQYRMLTDLAAQAAAGAFAGNVVVSVNLRGDISSAFTGLRPSEAIGMLTIAIKLLEHQLLDQPIAAKAHGVA